MSARQILITSFGFLHSPDGHAPTADFPVDLRDLFYDPHRDPTLKYLTGRDERVKTAVRDTPGVGRFRRHWVAMLRDLYQDTTGETRGGGIRDVTVAFGCAGGRHRSYVIAEDVAARLRYYVIPVEVVHRDVDKPVVEREVRDAGR